MSEPDFVQIQRGVVRKFRDITKKRVRLEDEAEAQLAEVQGTVKISLNDIHKTQREVKLHLYSVGLAHLLQDDPPPVSELDSDTDLVSQLSDYTARANAIRNRITKSVVELKDARARVAMLRLVVILVIIFSIIIQIFQQFFQG